MYTYHTHTGTHTHTHTHTHTVARLHNGKWVELVVAQLAGATTGRAGMKKWDTASVERAAARAVRRGGGLAAHGGVDQHLCSSVAASADAGDSASGAARRQILRREHVRGSCCLLMMMMLLSLELLWLAQLGACVQHLLGGAARWPCAGNQLCATGELRCAVARSAMAQYHRKR